MFELWASTASHVARCCSTQNCVRIFVFASRAGDRRIRPQSWKARCVTPWFPRVCVCLSSDNLLALPQGPWVSVKERHCVIVIPISANPDRAHIAHHFSSVAEASAACAHRTVARQACPLRATTEPARFESFPLSLRVAMLSSAVSSVRYRDAAGGHSETGLGSYVYCGDAASFHEW